MADLVNSKRRNSLLFYLLPVALCLLTSVDLRAQEEEPVPDNIAPPAVRAISKEEKTALAGLSDVKLRTKLTIDLMEARLKKAEEFKTSEAYPDLLTQLASFQALLDDGLKFLNRNDSGRGKVMDTFKKFEMALRTFTPRLEIIRREVPDSYAYHVRKLLITVRDARAKAVEPMFSSTVVPSSGN